MSRPNRKRVRCKLRLTLLCACAETNIAPIFLHDFEPSTSIAMLYYEFAVQIEI